MLVNKRKFYAIGILALTAIVSVHAAEEAPDVDKPTEVKVTQAPQPAVINPDSEEQKRAYASGIRIANDIVKQLAQQKAMHITLDKNLLIAGMMDAFHHQEKMSESDINLTLSVFDEQLKVLTLAEDDKRQKANLAYVENFSESENVKKSPKGYYYLIEEKGEGADIGDNTLVAVRFKVTLIDGTVIDQPVVENANQIMRVKKMMPALRDTIKTLHKGARILIVIPPSLVQNALPQGQPVPENSALIYTLNVVDVDPQS
ncbi:FKBP-type peptidyl-prolyl cis-trans isomerase N-terminal domain-containing protein [Erwinia billingiae]|uniref:FKBP-type peptidyl-prolyl cis-trans isomerase N-terminal domain-containing protein n=1 Tax=Erwinia billingiae TaxID=182337 RepID=UPI0017800DA5|nr:FKBP-type peptidyl-prolyl cis-trans isomerase N-terminal domain-containing protein [Erwinia billingiae]